MKITIREMTPDDYPAVMKIVQTLSEWFDEMARGTAIPIDLKYQMGFAAHLNGEVEGFITLYVAEGRLMIGWLGVRRDCQRRGIGKRLISQAETQARKMGIEQLATYTLGDSVDYPPYQSTRAFYFQNGFKVYQRKRTDNPGCLEEIWITKKILVA